MNDKRPGRQTAALAHPPSVLSFANIGGKFEGQGPLADFFDEIRPDSFFGEKTWEKAESAMQKSVLRRALERADLRPEDLDRVLAGDLLNQCIGSSFGLRDFGVPFYGLYGACSTMGEGLGLAAQLIDGGFARRCAAVTSSHFCTAERQYRMPVPYGSQRSPTAQWTATAAGCTILADDGPGPYVTHVTCGRIVDWGITDSANMGAAMAPAAYDTLSAFFRETGMGPEDFDLILTGDLGSWAMPSSGTSSAGMAWSWVPGSRTAACCSMTGSGRTCTPAAPAAGAQRRCCAAMCSGAWRRAGGEPFLFAPTGALLSPVSAFQGESIPGICHAVRLSAAR